MQYLLLAREEASYSADIAVVKKVCDEGLVKQFERAEINAEWIRNCLIKSDILCKDVRAMCTVLPHVVTDHDSD